MIDALLGFIAPHHCRGCDKIGVLLCDNCKYNITSEAFEACLSCAGPVGRLGICRRCNLPYSRAWVVGWRRDSLELLIDDYKFKRTKSSSQALVDLLDLTVARLPPETVVLAVPTIASHIRRRGYDHAKIIAQQFAIRRGLTFDDILQRATNTTQRGKNSRLRKQQAQQAFKVARPLSAKAPYLLIDDVITTGATVHYGARALKQAGAGEVWVAAIARNPLD